MDLRERATNMEKQQKHIPQLRFPEFQNDGEWEAKRLGEIITVNSGRDYKHLNQGDIPVYGTGGYMLSVDDKLSDIDAIGIGRKGTIDKPQFLKAPFWTVDTLFFLTTKDGYDLNFVFFLFQTIEWKKYSEQTGVPSLTRNSIEKIEVKVPPLAEQRRIAACLLALDEMLSATKDKLEQLKAYKKGLMQKLFPAHGKTLPEYRFKEFEKDGEWKVMKLGEIITEVKDTTNDSVSIPLYSLTIDEGITAKNERYERGFLVTKKDNVFKVVSPNDFVSNPMNLRFGAIGCNHNTFSVCVSGYYDVFRFKESGSSVFWVNYLKSDLLLHKYDEIAIGSLIEKRRVYYSNLQNLSVLVPTIQEQRKIADCLSLLDEIINAYAEKVVQFGQYKKGLMQQMFPTSK